ncbi:MAG: hypothetical protein GX316_03065, partial [Firmicutes bacterium]|nr:hypothetical protein [Bacillota bacterium]
MKNTGKYFRYAVLIGFLVMVCSAFYWQIGQRKLLAAHPANPQVLHKRQWSPRGGIFDTYGEVIADSVRQSQGYKRCYYGPKGLASTIGYYSLRYGAAGLEKTLDRLLMGQAYPGTSVWGRIRHFLSGSNTGYNVVTTIDLKLQQDIERVFGNYLGAAVVVEVETGRILAVLSAPGFQPNDVDTNWAVIADNAQSPLYNRAFAGFYPPGSVFKLIVLAAGLSQGTFHLESVFNDPGMVKVQGQQISNLNQHAWGQISLLDACAVSSNVVFIEMGQQIGSQGILDMA